MTQPTTPPAGDPPAAPPTTTPAADPAPAALPPDAASPVLADLAKERERRQKLEGALAESLGIELTGGGNSDSHYAQITAKLGPLAQLASALGGQPSGDGKTDLERLTKRFDEYEQTVAQERLARWRAEVMAEKQLPAALAARLQGATREELAADADALKALIPSAPANGGRPGTPAPDPTQGARGPVDIDAQIREAETKGDVRTAIRLKSQKLYAQQQR